MHDISEVAMLSRQKFFTKLRIVFHIARQDTHPENLKIVKRSQLVSTNWCKSGKFSAK